ncbi:hypothetical protein LguiA_015381 [Lonicera macranthoides]
MEECLKYLSLAAENGNIDALYNVIKQNRIILDQIDEIPFEQTPLHTAAARRQTHFAIEIMSLKPSLAKKLNPDGLSPLHLAIQPDHIETALKLVKLDPTLVRVKGKGRITPLHSVVQIQNSELLAEFLIACPHCIEDLTITDESAVHIAVKRDWVEGFKVLFGWICRVEKTHVLNYKDDDGNTVLHLAALNNQPQVMELLIDKVNMSKMNSDQLTALDNIISGSLQNVKLTRRIRRSIRALKPRRDWKLGLRDFLGTPETRIEKLVTRNVYLEKGMSSASQNMLLVIAVLIATAAYQAALSPPGGLWQGEATLSTAAPKITTNFIGVAASISTSTPPLRCSVTKAIASAFNTTSHLPKRPGKVVMPPLYFNLFLIFNTFAVTASVGMIFLVLKTSRFGLLLHFSLAFLMLSYMISVLSISPSCNALPPIAIAIQFCVISAFSIARLSVYFIQKKPLAAWSSRYSYYYRALHQYRVVSTKYM